MYEFEAPQRLRESRWNIVKKWGIIHVDWVWQEGECGEEYFSGAESLEQMSEPYSQAAIDAYLNSPRVFALKDVPKHIQDLFEKVDAVNRHTLPRWEKYEHEAKLWYYPPEVWHPENIVPLHVAFAGERLGFHGHLGKLRPVSLDNAFDEHTSPLIGGGLGLAELAGPPIYSGNKDKYRLLHKPSKKYADIFQGPNSLDFLCVSQKALDIIRDHVDPSSISVSEPVQYEDVDVIPDETFYLLDVVRKEEIIDVFNTKARWDYVDVDALPGYIGINVMNSWSDMTIMKNLDIDIARDVRFPDRIFCNRDLLKALCSAGVTGLIYEDWT